MMSKHIFWIASYPKSGNTLLRSILASLFFTKDGNFSFDLLKLIVTFEEMGRLQTCEETKPDKLNILNLHKRTELIYKNLNTLQSKTNLRFEEDFAFFKTHFNAKNSCNTSFLIEEYLRGIIYIYRDPRDVCVSWARYSGISNEKSLKFLLDKNSHIKWTGNINFGNYDENIPVYISSWHEHLKSWTENNSDCPKLFIKYEDLVYNKRDTLIKIINFFYKNFNIKITNQEKKVENIIKTTEFKYMQKMNHKKVFERQ